MMHKTFPFSKLLGVLLVFCPSGQAGEITIKALAKETSPDQPVMSVSMLGYGEKIKWSQTAAGLTLTVPPAAPGGFVSTFRIETQPVRMNTPHP